MDARPAHIGDDPQAFKEWQRAVFFARWVIPLVVYIPAMTTLIVLDEVFQWPIPIWWGYLFCGVLHWALLGRLGAFVILCFHAARGRGCTFGCLIPIFLSIAPVAFVAKMNSVHSWGWPWFGVAAFSVVVLFVSAVVVQLACVVIVTSTKPIVPVELGGHFRADDT